MRRNYLDIAVAVAIAVLAVVAVAAHLPGPVIVVLGIGLFAAPGYVWAELILSAAAPVFERVMVATGLALVAPILGGLAIYGLKISLHRAAWVGLLAALTIIGSVVLLVRGRGPAPVAAPQQARRRELPRRHLATFGAAGVIGIAALALSVHSAETQKYAGYTQLWMSPVIKNPQQANLGVSNQEGSTLKYRLVLLRKGKQSATWNLTLTNGETWQQTIPYTTQYSVTADLYRLPNLTKPYRTVDNGG